MILTLEIRSVFISGTLMTLFDGFDIVAPVKLITIT